MSVQHLTDAFMRQLGNRIKELAIVELFRGDVSLSASKLAFDYIVPVTWDDSIPQDEYKARLVCRVGYTSDGEVFNRGITMSVKFSAKDVLDPDKRDIIIEGKAAGLVGSMRQEVDKLTSPMFLLIPHGDMYSPHPQMKRIWL